ncbi:cleft lip and palate transmembrane 1 family protein [Trypanosoma theileri]|uniref:Cleft lip and palate transmembrane 1 family protein n=1 Tax=Trypanosoma theileri TaxID=67003 RepID=A0A1X0P8S5_9TRYP|nr:cleft lip and palate transmembrane 1 family protein [Trypanosoma theileri]ORC93225.1 cleft lip and palate transmembrane 1 family protein [Trypanosoma theileri]
MPSAYLQEEDAQNPPQRSIWQRILMYGVAVFFMLSMFGNRDTKSSSSKSNSPLPDNSFQRGVNMGYAPFAEKGDLYTIIINSSDNEIFPGALFTDLVFAGSEQEILHQYSVNLSKCATKNCSLTLDIKVRIKNKEYVQSFSLIRFLPPRRIRQEQKLFDKSNNVDNASSFLNLQPDSPWKGYFQPTLTLSPIVDFSNPLPPQIKSYYHLDEVTQKYLPLIYINNFWLLRDHLLEINATTVTSPFNFTVIMSPLPLWKFAIYINFEQSMKQQQEMGLSKSEDSDEIKRIFLETNPYFLGLTCVITLMHMLFEYLAFSNDVKFWRNRKDFKGLSLRTIVMNCYFQTIIFLYLLDGDETSWTILLPSGFGVLVEYWKLAQTARLVRGEGRWWKIEFSDSYDKRTRKHDDNAVRYLMYVMTPILFCYTVYSALFETHKGWYSFIISTQVRFIYFFGFAMMTPQIFINYKMKTVTQLPWRTFVYRALNTVIDDLFAFIIKMPWLHRLACFRDDVVFLILLYQRWIYPVDSNRSEGSSDYGDDEDGTSRNEGEVEQKHLDNKENQEQMEEKSDHECHEGKESTNESKKKQ